MKKLSFLMIFALAIIGLTSCEKDEDPIVLTLEEQYSDWSNLSWVSTDGVSTPDTYPKLQITIVGNEGVITHTTVHTPYMKTFSKIEIDGDVVTFPLSIGSTTGTFSKSDDKITLITKGLTITSHTYVLKIN